MFSLVFVCVHGLFIRSRACGEADDEGTIEDSKSDLTFTYEQSLWQDSYSVVQRVCLVMAELGGCGRLHFCQANGRGRKEPLFKALITILSNW